MRRYGVRSDQYSLNAQCNSRWRRPERNAVALEPRGLAGPPPALLSREGVVVMLIGLSIGLLFRSQW